MSKDHAKALLTPACLTTDSAQDSEPLEARSNRPEALPIHQNPLLSGTQCNFTKTPHLLFQEQGWTQRDKAGGDKSLGQERPPCKITEQKRIPAYKL